MEAARRKLIENGYFRWKERYAQVSKKRETKDKGLEYEKNRMMKKYFSTLLKVFYSHQSLDRVLHNHLLRVRQRLLKKSVCGLLAHVLNNTRTKHMLTQAHSLHSQHLAARALNSWKAGMPEIKQKNRLLKIVRDERNGKLMERAVTGMKMYLRYRKEKKISDIIMG